MFRVMPRPLDVEGANRKVLALLADLQAKRTDGFLFDMHYVKSACERLGTEVETLVASLIAMSSSPFKLRAGDKLKWLHGRGFADILVLPVAGDFRYYRSRLSGCTQDDD
jgi:hypothetical protein